jgi:hypothetical protein
MVEVRSRVHRILRRMPNFTYLPEGSAALPEICAGLTLSPSEEALGIYVNDVSTSSREALLVTTENLYLDRNRSWLRVPYLSIDRTIPPPSKSEVTGFTVLLRDSTEIWLPVSGVKNDRFYDAFEILRFIDRVKEDFASKK